MHEGYEPDPVLDFPNSYQLTSEHVAEVDLASSDADPTAGGDRDGAIGFLHVPLKPHVIGKTCGASQVADCVKSYIAPISPSALMQQDDG
jgi:hypothetical protein